MRGMKITAADRAWLQKEYPKLQLRSSGNREIVEGIFEFIAAYDEREHQYLINPTDSNSPQTMIIHDRYKVRISNQPNIDKLPKVKESGGRIRAVAKEKGIAEIDLHIYPDNSLCLVGPLDENGSVSFRDFLDGHVLQFFYDQSYFERFGRWPRGQYSHGVLGVFENYFERHQLENSDLLEVCLSALKKSRQWTGIKEILFRKDNIRGHWQCPCGSGKKFRNCHVIALRGMWCLQSDLKSAPKRGGKFSQIS